MAGTIDGEQAGDAMVEQATRRLDEREAALRAQRSVGDFRTPEGLARIDACAELLPPPGAEVVRAATAEIRRLRLREVSRVQPPPVTPADAAEVEWALRVIRKLCDVDDDARRAAWLVLDRPLPPVPMIIHCPMCRARHIDRGDFATKPHHTHACQGCGFTWRPAVVATVGVDFLPGFKDATSGPCERVIREERLGPQQTRTVLCGAATYGLVDLSQGDEVHPPVSLCPEHGGPPS